MPHVMELIQAGDGIQKRHSYMSHYDNIKKAVQTSKHRKSIKEDKFKIMTGFDSTLRKEILKQVTHILENNPELRSDKHVVKFT